MLINFEQIVILRLSNIGLTNLPYFWPFFAIIKETAHTYDQNLMLISILSNNYISVEALRRLCLALFPVIPAPYLHLPYTEYCGVLEGSNTFPLDISPGHSSRTFPKIIPWAPIH